MAEPTSSTTVAITAGAGLISLLPFVNGDALFGAVIGAAFVSFYSQQGGYEKRIGAFCSISENRGNNPGFISITNAARLPRNISTFSCVHRSCAMRITIIPNPNAIQIERVCVSTKA